MASDTYGETDGGEGGSACGVGPFSDTPDPCTDEAIAEGCTCTVVGYEELRRDQWCPLHGRDPDYELEKRRDAEIDHG